jgi:hypothetical protein
LIVMHQQGQIDIPPDGGQKMVAPSPNAAVPLAITTSPGWQLARWPPAGPDREAR